MCSLTCALDARVNWAHYRVATVAGDADAAIEYLQEASQSAFISGAESYEQGSDMPNLVVDLPRLAASWRAGWNHRGLCAEMEVCSGCNNGSGNPCPTHD